MTNPLNLKLPLAIVGYGTSGQALYALLLDLGYNKDQVGIFDESSPLAQWSTAEDLIRQLGPKTLAVSPGVPFSLPWIQSLKTKGIEITSELSLSYSQLTTEKVIGITGSIGKSTTTSLIGVAARATDPFAFVGGNLGTPLAQYILTLRKNPEKKARWVVLELSSYQLENFDNLRAEISVFTYLTPNHLERYSSLNEYYKTKWSLLRKTVSTAVFNSNGGDLGSDFNQRFRESSLLDFFPEHLSSLWCKGEDWSLSTRLLGSYNKDNLALAQAVCDLCSWPPQSRAALQSFSGLPHRLENLGRFSDRIFVNDSKATTMDSVLSAVQTLLEERAEPTIILLGGHDKNLPWEDLRALKKYSTLRCLFFGEFAGPAKIRSGLAGPQFTTLRDALEQMPEWSKPGDLILLSPGGTSHDEFKNFEERGNFFKAQVLRHFGS
jgi:UDP-N-acetylmuramoylalanine--D-glutamate ligase